MEFGKARNICIRRTSDLEILGNVQNYKYGICLNKEKVSRVSKRREQDTKVEKPIHDSIRESVTWECKEHAWSEIMNVLAKPKGTTGRWNLDFWRLEQFYTNF